MRRLRLEDRELRSLKVRGRRAGRKTDEGGRWMGDDGPNSTGKIKTMRDLKVYRKAFDSAIFRPSS